MQSLAAREPCCIAGMPCVSSRWCISGRPMANLLPWLKSDSWRAIIRSRWILELPGVFSNITSTTCCHRRGEKPDI